MKAIIIGGGIGGLAAGIALKRIGCQVAVYEQASRLREVGAGITLWSNAIKALEKIGAADAVLSAGSVPLQRGELRSWRGEQLGQVSTEKLIQRLGAPTVAIHRGELLAALHTRFDGDVTTAARCVEFRTDAAGVTVTFENGHVARGDVLIGADGIRSVVREQLHGPQPPRYAGYISWRGVVDFHHPDYPPGTWLLALGRGAQFGYVPLGEGRVYWFGSKNAADGTDGIDSPKEEALRHFAGWHEPVAAVIAATPAEAVLLNPILDRKPLRSWGAGRVTLLGDAAHATTPNLGQGACQAIEDAVVLAASLADANDLSAALRQYEAKRRPRTAAVVNDSKTIGRFLQWENPIACWFRTKLLRLTAGTRLDRTLEHASYEVPDLP